MLLAGISVSARVNKVTSLVLSEKNATKEYEVAIRSQTFAEDVHLHERALYQAKGNEQLILGHKTGSTATIPHYIPM